MPRLNRFCRELSLVLVALLVLGGAGAGSNCASTVSKGQLDIEGLSDDCLYDAMADAWNSLYDHAISIATCGAGFLEGLTLTANARLCIPSVDTLYDAMKYLAAYASRDAEGMGDEETAPAVRSALESCGVVLRNIYGDPVGGAYSKSTQGGSPSSLSGGNGGGLPNGNGITFTDFTFPVQTFSLTLQDVSIPTFEVSPVTDFFLTDEVTFNVPEGLAADWQADVDAGLNLSTLQLAVDQGLTFSLGDGFAPSASLVLNEAVIQLIDEAILLVFETEDDKKEIALFTKLRLDPSFYGIEHAAGTDAWSDGPDYEAHLQNWPITETATGRAGYAPSAYVLETSKPRPMWEILGEEIPFRMEDRPFSMELAFAFRSQPPGTVSLSFVDDSPGGLGLEIRFSQWEGGCLSYRVYGHTLMPDLEASERSILLADGLVPQTETAAGSQPQDPVPIGMSRDGIEYELLRDGVSFASFVFRGFVFDALRFRLLGPAEIHLTSFKVSEAE